MDQHRLFDRRPAPSDAGRRHHPRPLVPEGYGPAFRQPGRSHPSRPGGAPLALDRWRYPGDDAGRAADPGSGGRLPAPRPGRGAPHVPRGIARFGAAGSLRPGGLRPRRREGALRIPRRHLAGGAPGAAVRPPVSLPHPALHRSGGSPGADPRQAGAAARLAGAVRLRVRHAARRRGRPRPHGRRRPGVDEEWLVPGLPPPAAGRGGVPRLPPRAGRGARPERTFRGDDGGPAGGTTGGAVAERRAAAA